MGCAFMLLFFACCGAVVGAGNHSQLGTGGSLAVCQPDTCALLSEAAAARERVAAAAERQSALEESLSALLQRMASVEAGMQLWKSQVEELRKANQALVAAAAGSASRAAFTVALGDSTGPFQQDTPVKYQRILSNVGSGYNPATGVFTAMARGMYYFSYTMYNNNAGQPNSAVSLMMNSQRMVSTWDTVGSDNHDSATNAAVVQLEAGDSVFVQLYAQRVLYDDGFYYNTFSGFLLFGL